MIFSIKKCTLAQKRLKNTAVHYSILHAINAVENDA